MKNFTIKDWRLLLVVILSILFVIYFNYSIQSRKQSSVTKKANQNKIISITPFVYNPTDPKYKGVPQLDLVIEDKYKAVTDNEYFAILKNRIYNDKLSTKYWFENVCYKFWLWDQEDKDYFQVEIHENHSGICPGLAGVSPLVAMFRINRETKTITYNDIINNEFIPYEDWSKNINKE